MTEDRREGLEGVMEPQSGTLPSATIKRVGIGTIRSESRRVDKGDLKRDLRSNCPLTKANPLFLCVRAVRVVEQDQR